MNFKLNAQAERIDFNTNVHQLREIQFFADFSMLDMYIMVQRIGDILVVLLSKSYFIRRQKCS